MVTWQNAPSTATPLNAANLDAAFAEKAPLASPTFTGTVAGVSAAMVGLGSVDNTSDVSKPVSTAQAAAIALAAGGAQWTRLDTTNAQVNTVRQWGIARLVAPGGTIRTTPLVVTFPVAFSGVPHVSVSAMGYRATGAYNPAGLTSSGTVDAWVGSAVGRSTTAMTLNLADTTGGLMSAGYDMYVSWEAVGAA